MTACANNKVFSRHRYEYIFSPTVNNKKPGVVFNDAEAIEAIARAGRPWPNEVIAVPNRPGSYQIRVIYRGDGEDLTKGTFCQFQGIYGRRGSCRVGTSYHFHTIQFGGCRQHGGALSGRGDAPPERVQRRIVCVFL
jgi:hypothetical protein